MSPEYFACVGRDYRFELEYIADKQQLLSGKRVAGVVAIYP